MQTDALKRSGLPRRLQQQSSVYALALRSRGSTTKGYPAVPEVFRMVANILSKLRLSRNFKGATATQFRPEQEYLQFTMSAPDNEIDVHKISACVRARCAARYTRNDNVPCKIEEGLFLGSIGVANNKAALKSSGVTHILIVAKSLDPVFPNEFIYNKIKVLDSPGVNIRHYFDECIEFIDEARTSGGGVLVHCFAGRSRSVTIVVAYLMKNHHLSLSQALALVRSKRPHVAPNGGFLEQLEDFEKSLQVDQDAQPS